MSTLSEHQANGDLTEVRSQPEDTVTQIGRILQHLDVLSSKAEKHIFKYAYLYFFGIFLLDLLLLIINDLLRGYSDSIRSDVFFRSRTPLLIVIGISLILWTFNVWRGSVTKTLRDAFRHQRIYVLTGDVNTLYLELLEHYRHTLNSRRRYLLVGSLLVIMAIFIFYDFDLPGFIKFILTSHPNTFSIFFSSTDMLLISLVELGIMYCLGLVAWTLCISGQCIRRLSQTFEFRIEPVHPDNCGGLKMLGNFCFGLGSPILIGSAFFIGYIFVFLPSSNIDYVLSVGLILFMFLVYSLPVAILAFFLPLWSIHTKMLSEREADEEDHAARIAALRAQVHVLLDNDQLEEAKTVKEKKELAEALYIPSPTWPFTIRSKFPSVLIGTGGSFLLGLLTALPQTFFQAFLQALLQLISSIP